MSTVLPTVIWISPPADPHVLTNYGLFVVPIGMFLIVFLVVHLVISLILLAVGKKRVNIFIRLSIALAITVLLSYLFYSYGFKDLGCFDCGGWDLK